MIYLRRDIYWDCRDKSRSSRQIEIVKTNRDFQDLSRIFEISRHNWDFFKTFSRLQAQKSQQIEKSRSSTVITLTNSRSRKTVKNCQKCHVSTDFSVSIETFRTFRTCRDKIEISWSSRLTFWNCRDFLGRRDWLFFGVEIESLDRDHVETNRDPQAYWITNHFRLLNTENKSFDK